MRIMKVFVKSIVTSLMVASGSFLSAQGSIYLEISDCTRELQYSYSEPNGVNSGYFAYQFVLNDFEIVTLESSTYNSRNISKDDLITMNRITCGETLQNELLLDTIKKIQKGKQDIYLLKSNGNGFEVLNVTDVTYQVYLPSDKYLRVITSEYGFDYDAKNTYDIGVDLKTSGQGDLILLQEASKDCYDKPTFMHIPTNFMETVNIEYILGIGMVKMYSDLMEHRLVAIDGQPLQAYLATFCDQDIVKAEALPKLSETPKEEYVEMTSEFEQETVLTKENIDESLLKAEREAIEDTTSEDKGKSKIYKSIPVSRTAISKRNIHTVSTGETLYSISEKYNLTIKELKKMNELEEYTIEIGQKLKIRKQD